MNFYTTAITLFFAGSAAAFVPATQHSKSVSSLNAFNIDEIPGALAPMGIFDPLGFAEKADEATLKRYREAEVTHGRVAMLATVGFLVGEKVQGNTPFFDGSITGPAIEQIPQLPPLDLLLFAWTISLVERLRAEIGWVAPQKVPIGKAGLLRDDYYPGAIGFDPLGLMPQDEDEFNTMATKELQNGRLAMLAAAGFLAQEAVDHKPILESFNEWISSPAAEAAAETANAAV